MYDVNKHSKIAAIDFEYSVIRENLGVGPLYGFVIVKDNSPCDSTFIFNIKDFPDEESMIQSFFRTLDSLDYDYVLVSFLDAFLNTISRRAETLGVSLRHLVDPDSKYPDKDVSIVIDRTGMNDKKASPLEIWNYTYTVELPTNFKFMDMNTFYNNLEEHELAFGLNDMAKAELGRGIKHVGEANDCFNMSGDKLMKYCVDDTKLLHEVISSIIGKKNEKVKYKNDGN